MKNTIRETVKENYKTNKNGNVKFNKNVYDFDRLLNLNSNKSPPKNEFTNINTNYSQKQENTPFSPPLFFTNSLVIIFFILLLVSAGVFIFRDNIMAFFTKIMKGDDDIEATKKELESKLQKEHQHQKALKKELSELKNNAAKEKKSRKKEEPKSSIDKKIKQSYSSSQIINDDGYCFIGSDDNMRHCVDAYRGDVCTSGDVYKRMDECLIPKQISDEPCSY
jgi:hypothetical protein